MRLCGRNRIPRAEVGIAHALLRILRVAEHVVRQSAAKLAVFRIQFPNALLGTRKKQVDNLFIRHACAASFPVSLLYYGFCGKCYGFCGKCYGKG